METSNTDKSNSGQIEPKTENNSPALDHSETVKIAATGNIVIPNVEPPVYKTDKNKYAQLKLEGTMISTLPDRARVEEGKKVTDAVALGRTKRLIERCTPRGPDTEIFHLLLAFFVIAAESEQPEFAEYLTACYTTKSGEDIGEPPENYDCGQLYPQCMIANLEEKIGQGHIAERVKDDFLRIKFQAEKTSALANAYLAINKFSSTMGAEVFSFIRCLVFEFANFERMCQEEMDKIIRLAGTQALRPSPSEQKDTLNIPEAAEYAGKDERTIRSWLKKKDEKGNPMLPNAVHVGKKYSIPRTDLDKWK